MGPRDLQLLHSVRPVLQLGIVQEGCVPCVSQAHMALLLADQPIRCAWGVGWERMGHCRGLHSVRAVLLAPMPLLLGRACAPCAGPEHTVPLPGLRLVLPACSAARENMGWMVLLPVWPVLLVPIRLLLGFTVLVHCVGPEHTVPLQALRQALSARNAALGRTPPRRVLLRVAVR